MTTAVETTILLEDPRDWEEWYEVVCTAALARGVHKLIKSNVSALPLDSIVSKDNDTKEEAQSYADLDDRERDYSKVLLSEYRAKMSKYERQQKTLANIHDLIQSIVSKSLGSYIRGSTTVCDILQTLEKRLTSTDRTQRLELVREYQTLKKTPKTQLADKWLLQWETTYTEAEKLNLPEVQDNRALYDFIQAIQAINPAYASAYQVHVNFKV